MSEFGDRESPASGMEGDGVRAPLSGLVAPQDRDGLLVVELERFQGPLDLLLHLIREQDIDIFDIPIARITRQFLAAVEGVHRLELDSAGEFIEMAATLIRIKAQMLLPQREGEEEEQDPRAELVRRLLEYEQIREITLRLERSEADRSRRFGKGYLPVRPAPEPSELPLETTWDDVRAAAADIRLPERGGGYRMKGRPITLEEKVSLILATLERVTRIEFRKLLTPFREKMHGVMTLLAGLELMRRRRIRMKQAAPFHELWVYLPEPEEGREEPALTGAPTEETT